MSGPPRTPTETRKVKGNPGKRGYNKNEPQVAVGAPAAPADLNDDGLREWHRLVETCVASKVLTPADRAIVELAAHAYSTWIRAERVIESEGLTYETTNTTGGTVIKKRPEVEIASDGWRRYRAAICELGLTPAARAKVSAIGESDEADPAAKYFQ